jgi:hypothetical protein
MGNNNPHALAMERSRWLLQFAVELFLSCSSLIVPIVRRFCFRQVGMPSVMSLHVPGASRCFLAGS